MNSDRINLKSEQLFPFQFQLIGVILLIGGIASIPVSPYPGPFMLIFALGIFTSYRGIQFDRSTKHYRAYNSILFLKFGRWQEYDAIEMIYVNSSTISQKVYTRLTEGITSRNVEYSAYLQFSNGAKEFLTSNKDKNKLFAKLAPMSEFAHLEIIDNTV